MRKTPRFLGTSACLAIAFCALLLAPPDAAGQQHRAVRLGHPSTRFAPPLNHPDELRRLFANPSLRADILSILNQAGWKGDLQDLLNAAATAEITDLRLPRGSRLPYMSSRKDGKPVALIDVLWDGEQPIEAYAFDFVSRGVRYRCITPRPCSNFYVVELGSVPPRIGLYKIQPALASTCEPIEVTLIVTNSGAVRLTGITLEDTLPAGWKTSRGQTSVQWEIESLAPGQTRQQTFEAIATTPGTHLNKASVQARENVRATAESETTVGTPKLEVTCATAYKQVPVGRPVSATLTIRNVGDRPEPRVFVTMAPPADATQLETEPAGTLTDGRLTWELPALEPGGSKTIDLSFMGTLPRTQTLDVAVAGLCAPATETHCITEIIGIPAILLEVIDLEDPIEVGKEVVYEIRVLNQGSIADTGVRLECRLDDSQEYLSGSGPTPVTASGRDVTTEPLAQLAPRETATWRITCRALNPADARFRVRMTSDSIKRSVDETESTRHY